jgi:hypothetical protein
VSEIKVETPSEEKLKKLGVEDWAPWERGPSSFDWEYEAPETAYILEGKAQIKTEFGQKLEIGKGDLVRFPQGLKCSWHILKRIRKLYAFLE